MKINRHFELCFGTEEGDRRCHSSYYYFCQVSDESFVDFACATEALRRQGLVFDFVVRWKGPSTMGVELRTKTKKELSAVRDAMDKQREFYETNGYIDVKL